MTSISETSITEERVVFSAEFNTNDFATIEKIPTKYIEWNGVGWNLLVMKRADGCLGYYVGFDYNSSPPTFGKILPINFTISVVDVESNEIQKKSKLPQHFSCRYIPN